MERSPHTYVKYDWWYNGGSIIVAGFLVVIVSAVSNFKQNRQFERLSNIGDQILADGLFLEGYSRKVEESSMTGESDHVEIDDEKNPFLMSGTKVTDGYYGVMVVTSVGLFEPADVGIVVVAVTIVAVAIPEGLPLAVTLTLV
ncbi:hypothetical protein LWI29_018996 [Acer saccharum]|uniref:P-type ATPase A domain-containing protein n=1 Tax=Acer saccharum TaxID=4024 RepID=A0AA39T6J1_ACESA|nr:hypothetical protein LWI29_018996 [Acer saccharum]